MATTYIAEASIDERGQISHGSAGDQTGKEVHVNNWYSGGWTVLIRYKDSKIATLAAAVAKGLADSHLVGYDQSERSSLRTALSRVSWDADMYVKLGIKSETDCSAFVTTCFACLLTNLRGIRLPTTTDIAGELASHGFSTSRDSKYLTSPNNLIPGDILVNEGTHAVIVIDGPGNPSSLPADGNEDGVPTVDPKSLIDATAITAYIASPSYKTVDIDYKKLVKSGVVGVMFYGGSYFNDNHEVKKRYNPANLSKQVAGANKAKMPYGLHVKVRARTVEEARAECNSLYYVISNYPPELGLWLELELVKNKSKNNKIIETYYKYIYQWGLKDKCGFYVTRQQLSYISWDKFYDDFLLWLISPVNNIKDVDGQLLDPEFFMLDK